MKTIRHPPEPSLSRHRRAFIAELAESVAEEHSPTGDRVDPEAIARACGITVSCNDYGTSFDGLLQVRAGRFHIYCNLAGGLERSDGRVRFTVAHELGHFFLPEHRAALLQGTAPAHPSFCNDPYPENQVELEADFFASRLLLPEARFRKALSKYGLGLDSLGDIANVFGASLEATVRRVVEMPDIAQAAVLFRDGAAHWGRVSPRLAAVGLRKLRVHRASVHAGSATYQAQKERPGAGIFSSSTSAHHWFSHVEPGGSRDLIMREEALKNRFYTLALLTVPERDLLQCEEKRLPTPKF